MVLREARGFSTGLCRDIDDRWGRAIWFMNAIRVMLGCRARALSIEAALRNLIVQGSCWIAQPHGQHRVAITATRIISSYSPYGVTVCPEC